MEIKKKGEETLEAWKEVWNKKKKSNTKKVRTGKKLKILNKWETASPLDVGRKIWETIKCVARACVDWAFLRQNLCISAKPNLEQGKSGSYSGQSQIDQTECQSVSGRFLMELGEKSQDKAAFYDTLKNILREKTAATVC